MIITANSTSQNMQQQYVIDAPRLTLAPEDHVKQQNSDNRRADA